MVGGLKHSAGRTFKCIPNLNVVFSQKNDARNDTCEGEKVCLQQTNMWKQQRSENFLTSNKAKPNFSLK